MPIKDMPELAIALAAAGTTYSEAMESGHFASREIECSINITAIVGTSPLLNIVPQYSYDKKTWFDQPAIFQFTQITDATSLPFAQTLQLTTTGLYMRFKFVAAGSVFTSAAGSIWAVMKS